MTALPLDTDLLCCRCRQNLRGVPDGRCPECGRAFRRDALLSGRVAWEQRREIGRARAYLRTLQLVLRRPAALVRYADAPVDYAAARAFRRWTVVWATLVSAAVAAGVLSAVAELMMGRPSNDWPSFWDDEWTRTLQQALSVIFTVGRNPVFFAASVVATALWLAAVTRTTAWFFRDDQRPADPARRARAAALGQYAAAPFAWVLCVLLLASLTFAPQVEAVSGGYADLQPRWEMVALALLLLCIPVFWFASSTRLLRRVTGCSATRQWRYVLALPLLAAVWAVGVAAAVHFTVFHATLLWAGL